MSKASDILDALGGADNVTEYQPCITRLRVRVVDVDKVDETALTDLGAYGVVHTGQTVQVILGPKAEDIGKEFEPLLAAPQES
ncbi:MAG: glucose PTS transporter subunit EIIB [Cellulomonadaceae bacterium]|jgi:PTS system N-acetylglucosamine-specific IIB component|nr:glucose PTS transporter subunit EIIB [Cellulomonadaceae bacterium]